MKGILFDCDGVLVETEPLFAKASMEHLKDYGVDADYSFVTSHNGLKEEIYLQNLMTEYHIDQDMQIFIEEEHRYLEKFLTEEYIKPMPGIQEFIDWAKEKYKLGIGTASDMEHIHKILKIIDKEGVFSTIITGDRVQKGKPDPEVYLKGMEKLGIKPEETIVIEDSKNGIQAAKNAGAYAIGYKASEIEQDTSKADFEAYTYDEIKKHILEMECE